MPVNKIDVVFTDVQRTAVEAALDALMDNLPAKINLTKKEKEELQNIDNNRQPYVRRAIKSHAPANPNLVSGYAGTLEEANNDMDLFSQLNQYILQLKKIMEMYVDLQHLAGSEAYVWFREFYNSAQKAADNMVPGADSVVEDLAPLFEEQGNSGQIPDFPNP